MPTHGQSLPFACAGSVEAYGVTGFPNSVFIWEVVGGTIVDNRNDSVLIRWDREQGVHSITVVERTEFNCYGEPIGASVPVNGPVANIGDNEEICLNDIITFDATTSYGSGVTYLWPDGSTGNTFSTGAEGYIWVRVTGMDDLCSDTDSAYLTVNPLPVVDLGNDTTLCGTETMLLNAGFFANYEWSTGDIINPITVDGDRIEPELIWVTVTDENGCRGSDTVILNVCDATLLFRNMPNTITPGDDNGENDTWHIPNIDMFPDAVLEIFDRWGRLVFRTNDIANNEWDGTSMSGVELPMDAYYFVIDLKIPNVKPMTGYVNVIR
ncbi:MAG: gliding motility-associated C-terminal domain-containing protein [Bacteroidales bacterium]